MAAKKERTAGVISADIEKLSNQLNDLKAELAKELKRNPLKDKPSASLAKVNSGARAERMARFAAKKGVVGKAPAAKLTLTAE